MELFEFIIYAVIIVFVASLLTFSLSRRFSQKIIKYIPAVACLAGAVGFGIAAYVMQDIQSIKLMFWAFFSFIGFISAFSTVLAIEKSK
ncbi:MAG: hypothetical protein AB1420_10985 [Bacillota bacterium]